MPGRYGVSARSTTSRPVHKARRSRGLTTVFLGSSMLIATSIAVVAGPAVTTPDQPVSGGVAVPLFPERHADDTSRSVERDPVYAKMAGAGIPKVPAKPETSLPDPNVKPLPAAPLPADSGTGHRVVFDITRQQVWLVDASDTVVRTYLVSGSRFDQLPTGTFEVFSTSRNATSWHGTETMEYMVRFYRGENSNIGFHDLPVDTATGAETQTLSQLGIPLSDGCIRQDLPDAKALWKFAPVGTAVVVVRS